MADSTRIPRALPQQHLSSPSPLSPSKGTKGTSMGATGDSSGTATGNLSLPLLSLNGVRRTSLAPPQTNTTRTAAGTYSSSYGMVSPRDPTKLSPNRRTVSSRRRSSLFLSSESSATPRGGARTSRMAGGGGTPSGAAAAVSGKRRRPSLHVMNLVDKGNTSNVTPQGSPATTSLNLGTNLRSQLNRLDNNMLRTFDSKTGTIEVSHKSTVPRLETLVRTKYLNFWRDQSKVAEAEEVVRLMKVSERRAFAVESVKRKHEEELKRILAKDVFSPDISVSRVQVSLQMSLEHIVGHLDQDTRPLSIIRMQGAATDTVIYKKAEREAAAEISHFHAKVIPNGTTAVQLMSMAIDSYKERFVPPPPRQSTGNSPIPIKPSGRIQRRPSGVFPFGLSRENNNNKQEDARTATGRDKTDLVRGAARSNKSPHPPQAASAGSGGGMTRKLGDKDDSFSPHSGLRLQRKRVSVVRLDSAVSHRPTRDATSNSSFRSRAGGGGGDVGARRSSLASSCSSVTSAPSDPPIPYIEPRGVG